MNQNKFGMWGTLRESDLFKKQREFEVWMQLEKKVADASHLQKWEMKEYFKEYIEDFNTATLPHEKYVNYEKWEMQEWEKKKQRDAKRASKSGTAAASATDEADLAQERRRKKNIANQQEFDNMIMASYCTKERVKLERAEWLWLCFCISNASIRWRQLLDSADQSASGMTLAVHTVLTHRYHAAALCAAVSAHCTVTGHYAERQGQRDA
eukprot:17951-Heterococcus_DN1.PRE.1